VRDSLIVGNITIVVLVTPSRSPPIASWGTPPIASWGTPLIAVWVAVRSVVEELVASAIFD